MFSVKIQYKGKIINLGKSISSIQQIQKELKDRFPIQFKYGVQLSYQNEILTDFSNISEIAKSNNSLSIKFKANPILISGNVQESQIININTESVKQKTIIHEYQKPQIQKIPSKIKFDIIDLGQVIIPNTIIQKPLKDQYKMSYQDEFNSSSTKKYQKKEEVQKKLQYQNIRSRSPSNSSIISSKSREKGKISKLKQNSQSDSQKLHQILIQSNQKSEKNKISNNSQFQYPCYKCLQKETENCIICFGKKGLEQNHPLVKLIDKILQDRMDKMMINLGLKEKKLDDSIKKIIQPKLSFEIIDNKISKIGKVGQKIFWQFQIKNNGDNWMSQMRMIDEKGQSIFVGCLLNGQSKQMSVGPFTYLKAGKYEKIYKLFYINNKQQEEYLNKRFGFSVTIEEPEKKKVLTNHFRKRVQLLARQNSFKYGVQFLIEKLRQLGFSEQNSYQADNQVLIQIIRTLSNP